MAGENDIKFTRTKGGLGRPKSGEDHYSAMVFYTDGSFTGMGFSATDRIKKILNVQQAEDLGIVNTHADETVGATGGGVLIAVTWIAGETTSILVDGATIATFVVVSGSVAIADIVTGLVAAVNAGTNTGLAHGWSAVDTASTTVTLTQPAKLGVTNNTGTPITFTTDSAAGTGTPTQLTGGAGSFKAVMHYHISEFFRIQPKGILWVGIYAEPTYAGTEIKTITDFTDGKVRQTAVNLTYTAYAASQLTSTQTILDTLHTEHAPQNVVFHADFISGSETLAGLASLKTLSNERVSFVIGEDGDWHQGAWSATKTYIKGEKVTFQGASYISKRAIAASVLNSPFDLTKWTFISYALNTINGFSISTTGAALGAMALASVHESISWVSKFNLVSGTGLQEAGFATGDLYKNLSTALKDTLSDYNYIYLRTHRGQTGTYFNDSYTAIARTDDFATIENNRTVDKAERGVRANNLVNLSSPLYLNGDGSLSEDTIEVFKEAAERALIQMQNDGEISGSDGDNGFIVEIDPEQDVLASSEIELTISIVPVGVARTIQVNIGLTPKIG